MRLKTSYVNLNNVRFYAYHGVMPQERRVGGWFTVTLRLGYPIQKAMCSDNVDDTVSYAALFELVKREMAVPSQLLEHVAGRIVEAISKAFPSLCSIDLWIQKVNPPMGADCDGAGVELHLVNDEELHLVNDETSL